MPSKDDDRRAAAPHNRLLAALSRRDLARMRPALTPVTLEARQVMYDPDQPIESIYFPETCVISIVGVMTDGSAVETATVGNEGMVGLPVFFGDGRTPAQAFCQVPGAALRMRASAFRREIAGGGRLVALVGRYAQALMAQVGQSSACNRLHPLRQRCARWLLQTHDRVGDDAFPFTHQFLSQMLGVRRGTVTELTGELEREGLIRNQYGRIVVVDRRSLERVACECYRIIRREFERLLEGRDSRSPLDGVRTSEGGRSVLGEGAPRSSRDAPDGAARVRRTRARKKPD